MEYLKAELETEFKNRRNRNPSYSLRSFAQYLEVNSGTLSQILANKRKVSGIMEKKLWTKLGKFPQRPAFQNDKLSKTEMLESDAFQVISDWSHFALLELFELNDFEPNIKWMGKKLGLPSFEVNLTLERLVRVGLLQPKGSFYAVTKKNLSTLGIDVSNHSLQFLQRQILLQAIEALESVSVDKRDQSTLTVAVPKKALPEFKKRITQFRREMNSWLSDMKNKDDVYQLTISLFPANPKKNRGVK